jgi:hypothetical protein
MQELLLGISGALIFFLLSHLAMLTYYKKYQYWWHYYCDLGYPIPENRTSMCLYRAGLSFLAVLLLPLWLNIGLYVTRHVVVIQAAGVVGCLSFLLLIAVPYERSRRVHFVALCSAFTGSSVAIVIANQELQHALVNLYGWCFVVYLSLVIITTALYRKEMKRAHRVGAPMQKTFVLIFLVTIIVFCLALATA